MGSGVKSTLNLALQNIQDSHHRSDDSINSMNNQSHSALIPEGTSTSGNVTPTRRLSVIEKPNSDNSVRRRCERTVHRNKYERNAPEIRNWWYKLFAILEEDASIPTDMQKSILEQIFPDSILMRILNILSTQDRSFKEELKQTDSLDTLAKLFQTETKAESIRTDKRASIRSIWDPDELLKNAEDMKITKKIGSGSLDKVYAKVGNYPKSKMYTDFFQRKPNRAAVWRTLPPLSLDEMNLNQKADAITEKIATDFIVWLRDLGGDEELSLSVEAVIAMFEIGFHANSATSLKVEVKEMPSVPSRVADARNLPNRAKRAVLHNEIKKDIKASKKKTTLSAFGGRLPSDMQVRPPAENYYRKWMSCDRVPEKLASMAAVWQGITHLKSTRAYCEFLIERPEVKPPKYLMDCGMLDIKYLREKDDKSEDISFEFSLPNIFTQ